jgi:hypothetical protein
MTTDERRRVLDMLAQGKLTVEEADQLLRALDARRDEGSATAAAAADAAPPRWVRIQVLKPPTDGRDAKAVNIRVPIAVVKGGMRLGAIIATFAGEKAAQRMKERGLDLDLSKINTDFSKMNGAEFDAFMKSLDEMNIQVDDGRSQVRITCE